MKVLQFKPNTSRAYYHFDAVASENMTTGESVALCYDLREKHMSWKVNARRCYFVGKNAGVYVVRSDNRHFGFVGFQFQAIGNGLILRIEKWVDTNNGLNELIEKYSAKEIDFASFHLRWVSFIKKINAIDFSQVEIDF